MNKRAIASGVALLFGALALVSGCGGGPEKPEIGSDDPVWIFDLSHGLPESKSGGGIFSLPQKQTLLGALQALDKAASAPHVKGVFVRLGAALPPWSQSEELGRRLSSVKAAGRPVVCHADALGNRTLMLAAAGCSEIWLSPGGSVEAVGMGGQALYFRGLLDRLNIKAEFLHVGRYKSAAEMFTESGPSPEAQESMQSLLSSLRQSWRAGLAQHRQNPAAADAAENGPWVPQAALSSGLIDAVGFESEAREKLATLTQTGIEQAGSALARDDGEGSSPISVILRLLTTSEEPKEPHVAVLPAVGAINYMQGGAFGDETIAASSFVKTVRRLRDEDSVKAVVLRIDSPGGSALASDLIWHELRRLAATKPLIASVGDMAASGGYYLASAADQIWAEQTSLVGSIGVVGGKFTVGEALAELGITAHTFTPAGQEDTARVAYASPLTAWDDATRERVRDQMEQIYGLFIERVALGRKLPRETIEAVAEGRVWSGAQGKERGLVDELGGLWEAVAAARDRAGLPNDAPVEMEGGADPLKQLLGLSDEVDDESVRAAASRLAEPASAGLPAWLTTLGPQQRRHLASLMPLLGQERVIAAMPFGLKLP